MKRIATEPPTASNCFWSGVGFRLTGIRELEQPEPVWVCTRNGDRRPVNDDVCSDCPHWRPDAELQPPVGSPSIYPEGVLT